jgi:hypothetical protein
MSASLLALAVTLALPTADSAVTRQAASGASPLPAALTVVPLDTTPVRRRRTIEHGDAYYKRLTVHRVGSYAMLPLFAIEYPLGQKLLTGTNPPNWMKPAHSAVAGGIGALFAINTITGGWNLWEARHDEDNRVLRIVHSALMLASDGGFVWTGVLGAQAKHSYVSGNQHRNVAIGSMAVATAGTALMWFWKD